jgi:hypothetical protein
VSSIAPTPDENYDAWKQDRFAIAANASPPRTVAAAIVAATSDSHPRRSLVKDQSRRIAAADAAAGATSLVAAVLRQTFPGCFADCTLAPSMFPALAALVLIEDGSMPAAASSILRQKLADAIGDAAVGVMRSMDDILAVAGPACRVKTMADVHARFAAMAPECAPAFAQLAGIKLKEHAFNSTALNSAHFKQQLK